MILFQKDFSIPLSSKESSLKHWKVLWYDLMASSFSLKDACLTLGLNQTLVKLHRSRKGLDTPYQFWIFYPLFGKSLSKKFKGQN